MNITKTNIDGVLIIEPKIFGDERGFFVETYNLEKHKEAGMILPFVQDNLSSSAKGVLRGLHFQKKPFAQGKLVQVIKGKVLDVAVDIRKNSPTRGQYVAIELSGENKKQLWIAPGLAHGFLSLEDDTIFSYKCTNFYNPASERGVMWDDKDLNIDWKFKEYGIDKPIVSEKDQKNLYFSEL
ncbi:MAG TPA: dTDP-4-dehydrorhamnose 3,5-epimerase [Candidatus Moranbacteria bacterium]|nr:MAG: dTDP-4-dehydrorhamnose 3,5-epimerase [Candidatus Moranbacteria bacterium GW2011_GWF1_34_10]HBI16688.1 dTDP-4-dehydrorhamnose 3,5-epimerase [Candidatus Moranbacteria bacterium]